MSLIFRSPFQQLVMGPLYIRAAYQRLKNAQAEVELPVYCSPEVVNQRNKEMKDSANQMIKAGLRIALAVASIFALRMLGTVVEERSLTLIGVVGIGFLSVPTALIMAGTFLINKGIVLVISSIANYSFAHLALSFTCLAGGYLSLVGYDFIAFGLLEKVISCIAKTFETPLVRLINPSHYL